MGDIAALIGPKRAVVEFGSGSCTKTPILLSEVSPVAYAPIDISAGFLRESVAALSTAFPNLPIFPIEGDFTGALRLPQAIDGIARLGFFPASTIGNLQVSDAVDLLRAIATTLGDGRIFSMARGETVHTENSYKYDARDARVLLRAGGWTPIAEWTDREGYFSLILAKVGVAAPAPNHVNGRAMLRVMETHNGDRGMSA